MLLLTTRNFTPSCITCHPRIQTSTNINILPNSKKINLDLSAKNENVEKTASSLRVLSPPHPHQIKVATDLNRMKGV